MSKIAALLLAAASLATLGACASTESRDVREDLHNDMKHDAVACGTDTRCLQKREKAHGAAAPSASSARPTGST